MKLEEHLVERVGARQRRFISRKMPLIRKLHSLEPIVPKTKNPAEAGSFDVLAEGLSLRAGIGDRERAAVEVLAIPHGNSGIGARIIGHLHEAEAPGAAGLTISHN